MKPRKTQQRPPERREIDFNRILRNRKGEPYRTATGGALRLGQIVVEALDASGGRDVDATEKLRRDALARAIVTVDLEGPVEKPAPYNVLKLPDRILRTIDQSVDVLARAGMYAAAHRLLMPEEEQPEFDDVEVVSTPSKDQIESDDGVTAETIDDPEEQEEAAQAA